MFAKNLKGEWIMSFNKEQSKFVKGQVWYWNDPAYGKKEDGYSIAPKEGGLRYSRYVLIVQDTDSMSDGESVLVAPLSTRTNHPFVVPMQLTCATCVRVNKIMPVQVCTLSEYVTTLGEPIMKEVTNQLWQLLFGGCNLSYNETKSSDDTEAEADTTNNEEVLSPEEKPQLSIEDIEGLTIERYSSGRIKWSPNNKRMMIQCANTYGLEKTAEIFGIKATVIPGYISKFKKALALEESADSSNDTVAEDPIVEAPIEDVTENTSDDSNKYLEESTYNHPRLISSQDGEVVYDSSTKEIAIIPNDDNLVNAISCMANFLTKFARDKKFDNYPILYPGNNPMKKSKKKDDDFFNQFSCSCYYALLSYFGITEINKKLSKGPDITAGHNGYNTAKSLIEFADIVKIDPYKTAEQILITVRKDSNVHISEEWLPLLESQLRSRYNMRDKAFNRIIDSVKEFICD